MNMIEKVANALYEFHDVKSTNIAKDMARAAIETVYAEIEADRPTDVSDIHYLFYAALKE